MEGEAYAIKPVTKPRQTQRDKWLSPPRKCVGTYRAFKYELQINKFTMPTSAYHLWLVLPMPKSWSAKKKADRDGTAHLGTPDKDNLEKAILDSVFDNDSHVWDGRVTKVWGYEGMIVVQEIDPPDLAEFKLFKESLCQAKH